MIKKLFYLFIIFSITPLLSMENKALKWKIKGQVDHDKGIKCCTFIPDTNCVLILDFEYKQVVLKKLNENGQDVVLPHTHRKKPLISDNKYIVTTCSDSLRAYDFSGKIIRTYLEQDVDIVKINNQRNEILTVDYNKKISLLDVETKQKKAEFNLEGLVTVAKFVRCEPSIFISYRDHNSQLWDTRSNLINLSIPCLSKASIHPIDNYCACICYQDKESAYLYDLRKHDKSFNYIAKATGVKFSPYGNYILSQYISKASLWDLKKVISCLAAQEYPKNPVEFTKEQFCSAVFNPKQDRILTYTKKSFNSDNSEDKISIWDINGKELESLPYKLKIYGAKYDKTGNYIISKHDKSAVVWEKD